MLGCVLLDQRANIPDVLQLVRVCHESWDMVDDLGKLQLYQVHLWLRDVDEQSGALELYQGGLAVALSQSPLQECAASWAHQLEEIPAGRSGLTLFHQQVLSILRGLPRQTWQQQPAAEQRTADGAFSIDIAAVTAEGVSVAVEVDGPTHFLQPGNKLDGPTAARNRALEARGYRVVSVPYWEWEGLSSSAQHRYMLARLQAMAS